MAAWGKISVGPEYSHSLYACNTQWASNLESKLKTLELLYEMWIHFNGIGSSGVKWHRYKKSICLGIPQLGKT